MARKTAIAIPTYEGSLPDSDVSQDTTNSNELVNQSELDDIAEPEPETLKASDLADDPSDEPTEAEPEEKPSEVGLTKELFFGRPAEVRALYPKGCVKWERLFADHEFNIRDAKDSYTPEALAQMLVSLADFGQEEAVMVSLQERDQLLKTIRGNRRLAAMAMQRDDDLKLVATGKLDKSMVRWQYVRCEIKSGLSLQQETVLMLDHGPRKGLRPPEIFAATVRLKNMGWTETQILRKLGFGKEERSKVTNHYKVATMPTAIQAEYSKYLSGDKTAIKMSAPVVTELYSARTTDRKDGLSAMGGGPNLKKAWEKVRLENGNGVTRSAGAKKNAENMLDRCESEHPLLVYLVQHILGQKEGIPNQDDVISNISRACNGMFPIDDAETVTVTEEGITREV